MSGAHQSWDRQGGVGQRIQGGAGWGGWVEEGWSEVHPHLNLPGMSGRAQVGGVGEAGGARMG